MEYDNWKICKIKVIVNNMKTRDPHVKWINIKLKLVKCYKAMIDGDCDKDLQFYCMDNISLSPLRFGAVILVNR